MQVSKLEDQIVEILEKKYKHTIDKDDPLMLTITAQSLVTEHLLDLHKNNLESEFKNFKEDLSFILKKANVDSETSKKSIDEHVRKTFLSLSESYKDHLSVEFLKAGQEYQKAQKWYQRTRYLFIGNVLCVLSVIVCLCFVVSH